MMPATVIEHLVYEYITEVPVWRRRMEDYARLKAQRDEVVARLFGVRILVSNAEFRLQQIAAGEFACLESSIETGYTRERLMDSIRARAHHKRTAPARS